MDLGIMLKLMNNLGQLRKHERWTRQQLEAYQAESLRRLREGIRGPRVGERDRYPAQVPLRDVGRLNADFGHVLRPPF